MGNPKGVRRDFDALEQRRFAALRLLRQGLNQSEVARPGPARGAARGPGARGAVVVVGGEGGRRPLAPSRTRRTQAAADTTAEGATRTTSSCWPRTAGLRNQFVDFRARGGFDRAGI